MALQTPACKRGVLDRKNKLSHFWRGVARGEKKLQKQNEYASFDLL